VLSILKMHAVLCCVLFFSLFMSICCACSVWNKQNLKQVHFSNHLFYFILFYLWMILRWPNVNWLNKIKLEVKEKV